MASLVHTVRNVLCRNTNIFRVVNARATLSGQKYFHSQSKLTSLGTPRILSSNEVRTFSSLIFIQF